VSTVKVAKKRAKIIVFYVLFQAKFDQFQFNGLGKAACKTANVSPDSVMQLAFQVPIL
jgi:hypothetical protein